MTQAPPAAAILSQRDLWERAAQIKQLPRVRLPELVDWNYAPCERHAEPKPDCEFQACGGPLFDHQTVGVAWLYAVRKGILASEPGTGKTGQVLAALCLAKQRGETLRAILVVPTTSAAQWQREARRFAPGLITVAVSSGMTKAQRIALYANPGWEVLIIGFHLATRDAAELAVIEPAQLVSDDVDPLLNPGNATHRAIEQLSESADRVIIANATNLQTQLLQLWAAAVPIGGKTVWRTKTYFQDRYVQKNKVRIHVGWEADPQTGRRRPITRNVMQTTGYKNLTDFRDKFQPMMIRHRYEDLADIRIPQVITENVFLDLHPAQRAKYEQLQDGVLELLRRDEPPQRKQVSAATAWNHGAQVCAGLPALGEPDGPEASSKLDWTVNAIRRWAPRKIVAYARNRGTIAALQTRLQEAGIGHETIWGVDPNKEHRQASQQRFWQDPQCRVMILSAAGERSLNLQNAQILVQIDLNLNPARIHQLMGRVRRAGSPHERVFAFSLLAVNTQEDRYQLSLATRQALFDAVHDEDHGDLFERLDPDELLRLIQP